MDRDRDSNAVDSVAPDVGAIAAQSAPAQPAGVALARWRGGAAVYGRGRGWPGAPAAPGLSSSALARRRAVLSRAGTVSDAIAHSSATEIAALSDADYAGASVEDRIQMIGIVLKGNGGDALRRLWDSFGARLEQMAGTNPELWRQSLSNHTDQMRQSREVKTLEAAFAFDVAEVAQGYLTENDTLMKAEMAKLGIPEKDGAPTPTGAQTQALQKEQAAAADLERSQRTREQLRTTVIAYHVKLVQKGGTELPEGGGVDDLARQYEPVLFDPDNKFEASQQPTDYLPGIRSWEDANQQHVELTNAIQAIYRCHPALFALGPDNSGGQAGAVATASPEQARTLLGTQMRAVRDNIVKARGLVPTLALQLTPIHEQLLANHVAANVKLKRDWSTAFLRPLGDDVIAQQQPGPWWQQLGAMALQGAAYVVVGLATGGLGPVLLAGAQAAVSVGEYEALKTAAGSAATPDTVLVTNGEVNAAALKAIIDVAMAFLAAVGAARATLAARVASQTGRALIADIGENAARNLLIELTPEATQALKQKLGADVLRDLGERLGGKTIERLAGEISGPQIQALVKTVGFEALENLAKEISAADIQAMLAKHGADSVKYLGAGLNGRTAKALADKLAADMLTQLRAKVPDAVQLNRLAGKVDRPQVLLDYLGRVKSPSELESAIDEIAAKGIPQGFTPQQFASFSAKLRAAAGKYGGDIRVQGSRAAGVAAKDADVDIAIRVSKEDFDKLITERFKTPNPGSNKEQTMLRSIRDGRIQRGELGLSGVGNQLARDFDVREVQISAVEIGGAFDNGPWVPLQ